MLVMILFAMVWYLCYLMRPVRFQYHLVFLDILNGIAEAKLKSTSSQKHSLALLTFWIGKLSDKNLYT
jgi:hypothetical protein